MPTSSLEHVTPVCISYKEEVDPLLDIESQLELSPPVHKLWDLDVIGIDPKQPLREEQLSYHT